MTNEVKPDITVTLRDGEIEYRIEAPKSKSGEFSQIAAEFHDEHGPSLRDGRCVPTGAMRVYQGATIVVQDDRTVKPYPPLPDGLLDAASRALFLHPIVGPGGAQVETRAPAPEYRPLAPALDGCRPVDASAAIAAHQFKSFREDIEALSDLSDEDNERIMALEDRLDSLAISLRAAHQRINVLERERVAPPLNPVSEGSAPKGTMRVDPAGVSVVKAKRTEFARAFDGAFPKIELTPLDRGELYSSYPGTGRFSPANRIG